MRLSSRVSSGSCSKAMPALVSGPVVTSVISPGAARAVSRMKSTACLSIGLRSGCGALRIEILQPVAEAGSEPLLEMDRSLHVGLGIADDRPPGAGGDRECPRGRPASAC